MKADWLFDRGHLFSQIRFHPANRSITRTGWKHHPCGSPHRRHQPVSCKDDETHLFMLQNNSTAHVFFNSSPRLVQLFFFFFASLQISISSSRSWLFKLYCCGPRVQQKPWPIGSLLFMHMQWIRFCFYPELYFTWVSSVYVTGGARIQSQREMLRGQSI